jgi:ATP-dependent DNA helicase PIF1
MYKDIDYLKERAILSPTNETVDNLNEYIVSIIPGETKEYLSCDKIVKGASTHESYDLLYPVEFLTSINGNNFPQHKLLLKKVYQSCYFAISINLKAYVMVQD